MAGIPDKTRSRRMILLLDIGNTNTHAGLAQDGKIRRHIDIPTASWAGSGADKRLARFVAGETLEGAALCSVVPKATPKVRDWIRRRRLDLFELTWKTVGDLGLDYPRPSTIGADRLANAIAVRRDYGAPSVVVGFGTAVAFDVVDRKGNYAGGIIAPGLSAMTDYLHEKTALLPRIRIRDVHAAIGKTTREAMLIGAVHGYRGLIREILHGLKVELKARQLPVVATGGYADLIARGLPEIREIRPNLTLEGLYHARNSALG
jgi:type III pantothenate kinase